MNRVALGNGNSTTRLGFGCAYLTGRLEAGRSARLIDQAYELGIRHFDVAPLYGTGTAEEVLGRALRGRRPDVTIATKVGPPRPHLSLKSSLARLLLAPELRHHLAGHLAPLRRRRATTAPSVRSADSSLSPDRFSVPTIEAELQESLRRLKTDYLDFYLLHEVHAPLITDDLLTFLDKRRQAGVFRAVGLASDRTEIQAIFKRSPDFFDVHQYSWSPLQPEEPPPVTTILTITHRAIAYAFPALRQQLSQDLALRQRLSAACGLDLFDPKLLAQAIIATAMAYNPQGIVLVGTRQKARIVENTAPMLNPQLAIAGEKLLAALRLEINKGRRN